MWDKFFELINIEVQCGKNYLKTFLQQETEALGNNIGKEPQKPRLKIEKYGYYIFTDNICSARNSMKVVVFCKHVLILQNNDSNFLTWKVA